MGDLSDPVVKKSSRFFCSDVNASTIRQKNLKLFNYLDRCLTKANLHIIQEVKASSIEIFVNERSKGMAEIKMGTNWITGVSSLNPPS